MNAPFMGKFRVTQIFRGAAHDGLDLAGIDSKEIHSTVNGKVVYAGWENEKDPKQGFGRYVEIRRDGTDENYYFGHLAEIRVRVGDSVRITQVIGIEGQTGNATGPHCHYCVRIKGKFQDINRISGIPNQIGVYDDGYRPPAAPVYQIGKVYRTKDAMNVRSGPGTGYSIKPRGELTPDGQKHAYQQALGVLKPGTEVTCLEVAESPGERWIRIPSGWICAEQNGEIYVA